METNEQNIEDETLHLMQKLDAEIYSAADAELTEYFFQWCKITDILLNGLKQGTISPQNST